MATGELIKFGYISYTSIQTSDIHFFILFNILVFIEKILATTSSFLADIHTGFLTHSSRSTTKYSGITFNTSLFDKGVAFLAISNTLSTS